MTPRSSVQNPASTRPLLPEQRLLLCCARTHLSAEQAGQVRLLVEQGGVDWEQILAYAGQHKLVPLLFWQLKQICPAEVPAPVLERLQAGFQTNAWRTLRMTEECLKLLHLFGQQDIRALPLKGPVLAKTLYDDPVLRISNDLDILVDAADQARAVELLVGAGFRVLPGTQNSYHTGFLAPAQDWLLELHRGLTFPELTTLSAADLLRRAQPAQFAGTAIYQLDQVDLLIFLCLHGAKHRWRQLRWISDIGEYLRVYADTDWPELLRVAEHTGHERVILLGLYVAQQVLAVPLPDAVLQRIQRVPVIPTMVQQIQDALFQPVAAAELQIAPDSIEIQALDSALTRRQLVLRKLILDLQPKQCDYQLLALPGPLAFFYYPLRLLRLLVVYRMLVLKRLVRSIRSLW